MTTESIYKFVEQPQAKKAKKQIYKSKYDPNGPLIGSTFCMQGTTVVDGKGFHSLKQNHVVTTSFGVEPQPPNPNTFLKKGTRQCRDSSRIPSVEHVDKVTNKPAAPSRNDKPVQGLRTDKNYLNCNAVEAINISPKKRKEVEVPFIAREDYGKVPAYLETVKAEIQHEKELVDQYVSEQYGTASSNQQQKDEVMNEAERRELINKLNQRWGEVNSEYQKYCHKVILDTPRLIKRKATQEAELLQLEQYIEKLSSKGPILLVG